MRTRLAGLAGMGGALAVVFLAALLCVGAFFVPDFLFQRGVRTAVAALTDGEASFVRVRVTDDGATIYGLAIHHEGRRLAYVERLELFCDPAVLTTMEWRIQRAELHAVELDLAEQGRGITLPPRTWALLWSPDEAVIPHTEVDRLEIHGLSLVGEGGGGRVGGSLFWAAADHVVLAPGESAPLSFVAAEARDLDLKWNGAPLGGLDRAVFDPHGVLLGEGVKVATSVQASGLPQWPPLLIQWIPDWAGGRSKTDPGAAKRDWMGADPTWWPWQPSRVEWRGSAVISDHKVALRPMVWTASRMHGRIGPVKGEALPWSVSGGVLGGALSAGGQLTKRGKVVGTVQATDLEAKHLDPYLAVNLSRFGVRIREGTLSADLTLQLDRSWLSLEGDARLYKVRFDRTSLLSGAAKGVLTTGSWLLGGHDKSFETRVHVRGDFRSDDFSPLRQLFGQVSAGIVKDAGKRVGKGVKHTVKGVGAVFKRVFRRNEGSESEPGPEPPPALE